ncbi:MAG TPA: ABC transporter substrate-binding protein [Candidatus Saccharimonadales bacterium]|nr:ABC transporter substrate-binding protein [Candidatus Saccharimonadales bacterium]
MRPLSLMAVLAIVLAACEATPPASTPSPSAAVLPSSAPATITPSPTAKVPLGGTLRVALAAPIGSLDPQIAGANPLVVAQIFEGLVARGPNGPVPALATKWLVGADARSWTFTLRDGVTFHDGTAVDAAAVAKSLGRANDPLIETAEAADPRTVVVTTHVPYGPFLSALATTPYLIVSPASRTSGTGPFRVPAGAEGARPLVLQRNDRYWRPDATGQKLPYLDALSFTAIPDPGTRLASIRAGNEDFVQDLATGDIGTIRTDPSLQLIARPATTVLYLGLNLSLPPLDDLRIRQAIAQSLNPQGLVDRLYSGTATPASQFPPPAMLGYDDSVTQFAKADVAAAKKLLADSGHPNLEVALWYVLDASVTVPDMRKVAEAVAADLAASGISAELSTIDPVTFAASVRDNRYPMWLGVASPPTFDPDELLGAFFIPKIGIGTGTDEPTEAGAWINAEVAGLLRKAHSEPDQSKRAELYKQVTKIVQREVPRIPLAWSAPPAAATKKVVNAQGGLFADVGMGK